MARDNRGLWLYMVYMKMYMIQGLYSLQVIWTMGYVLIWLKFEYERRCWRLQRLILSWLGVPTLLFKAIRNYKDYLLGFGIFGGYMI